MDDPEGWFALPTVKIYGVVKIDDDLVHTITRVDCTVNVYDRVGYSTVMTFNSLKAVYSTTGRDSADL